MSVPLVWDNLVAYSLQVLVLVAVGGLLPRLLRIHQPRTQLLYFRLLLAGSLLLPVLQPWRRPVVTLPPPSAAPAVTAAPAASPSPAGPRVDWEEAGLVVVVAGAVLRVLWLLVGMWRLRRLKTGSLSLEPLPEAIEAARLRTGAEAGVCVSEDVGGPVTFGARRPVVLLPPALLEQPYEAQFGIACHEFLHVRRHDWLYTVVEEFAGALVWFHPAVWWLLGQIRLAREQVVDREVVSITEAHEPYVHALLAMGGGRPQLDLAPATLFLRKRHLASRVHSLLKEVRMSRGRLISSYVLTAAVVLTAAWLTTVSFPLEASPMMGMQEGYPSPMLARVELFPNLPEPLRSNLRARLAGFQGRPFTAELREEILKAAQEVDSTARILMMSQSETAEGTLMSTLIVAAGLGGPRPVGVADQADFPPSSAKRIPVGRAMQQAKLINQPKPQYPPLARQARIQGTVRFTALIGVDGRVANLVLISGHPLLVPAAQEAVQQWTYEPTLLNGEPVEVVTQIDVSFSLM